MASQSQLRAADETGARDGAFRALGEASNSAHATVARVDTVGELLSRGREPQWDLSDSETQLYRAGVKRSAPKLLSTCTVAGDLVEHAIRVADKVERGEPVTKADLIWVKDARMTGYATKFDRELLTRVQGDAPIDRQRVRSVREGGTVDLPSRIRPRGSKSKRGGVGATNKARASAMHDRFHRQGVVALAKWKAVKCIAHYTSQNWDDYDAKWRRNAKRAMNRARDTLQRAA